MPELPEVETVVRDLRRSLPGRTITDVSVTWPRIVAKPSAEEFVQLVTGRRIAGVSRRGKYVIIELDRGFLLVHLKMSGRLRIEPPTELADKHVHVLFVLDDGRLLRFHDVRKFGRMYAVHDPSIVTAELGPEPLDDAFSLVLFRQLLRRRSGRLKPLLLNQNFVAGLGNIYADEALFAARLGPLRKADSLSPDEEARLYHAIRSVLGRAVAGRGTTLSDGGYTDVQGEAGAYQDQIAVYGRAGDPCSRCATPLERIVIGGRSAHFCPRCQADRPDTDRP